ncbi:MAG TPA: hypothetical protein VMT89_13695 [Candidatus Acidoferrales bacterium]|nr:hypothetical protein [Candidatus Acidoferrales bacterium]
MAQERSDEERVLKLIERTRLLIALDDEMPTEIKLNAQPTLKMLETEIGGDSIDQGRASGLYGALYKDLADYPDIEALLSAMRVFLPYL